MKSAGVPQVSIIIPVFRDWGRLRGCLLSLKNQTFDSREYEVIVVDNDAKPLAEAERPDEARYIHAPAGFAYAARNAGIAAARGDILAFIDSDCLANPGWVKAAVSRLGQDADLVAGQIVVFSKHPTLCAKYDQAFAFRQRYYVSRNAAVTANLFVKVAVLRAIGNFDPNLETAGDFDLCRRAVSAGYRLAYCPESIVQHPARERFRDLARKVLRDAPGGWHLFLRQNPKPSIRDRGRFLLPYFKPRFGLWRAELKEAKSEGRLEHIDAGLVPLRLLLHWLAAMRVTYDVLSFRARPVHSTPSDR